MFLYKSFIIFFFCLRYVKKQKDADPSTEVRMTPNYASRQIFTASQEKMLSEYLLKCSKMCYGKSTRDLRDLAYEIAQINNISMPTSWHVHKAAGVDWMRAFLKRNKELSIRQPEGCSLSRMTSFNKHNVSIFFDNLDDVLNRTVSFADGSRIWNLDETSTSTVVNKCRKIIGGKGVKSLNVATAGEKGTLVTTCCFINAMGNTMPPAMVFPRVNFRDHMINGAPAGTLGLASPTGWMVAELFPRVIEHFIKYSGATLNNPVLLIFDNHASHFSIQALNMAKESGVVILTIPPHSSNKMQPLDVSCYAPFKAYYSDAVDSWNKQNPGRVFSIYEVATCVGIAHEKAMTPATIKNGFRKCGIYPFDRNVFTEADFLLSAVTFVEDPKTASSSAPTASSSSISNQNSTSEVVVPSLSASDDKITNESPFIGPAHILGYPKAQPKQNKRRPREKGRSLIATDTPEKRSIEEKALVSQKKTKRKLFEKVTEEEEKDDETLSNIWSDTSSDGAIGFMEEETTVNFGELDRSPKEGEFVLVEFKSKQMVYYVGKVLKEIHNEAELEIQFLRRSLKQTNYFFFPQVDDIATVAINDIKLILPNPSTSKGTKRTKSLLNFELDFVNVEVR